MKIFIGDDKASAKEVAEAVASAPRWIAFRLAGGTSVSRYQRLARLFNRLPQDRVLRAKVESERNVLYVVL